jgi:hypothetical protein
MFMNYMDYVNDNCMIMFSPDQGAYMRQILNTSRSSLLNAASIKCSVAVPMVASILTQSDALCFGESSGTVTVDVTGGISPYTYALNGGVPQSSPTFQSLFAGTYTVTIFDSAGSQIDVNVTIAEPSLVTAFADFQINVSCFGGADGSVTLDAFGGTPFPGDFYEYSLNGSPFTTVNVFTDLPSGTYTYQVQDANACLVSGEVTIEEPNELVLDNDNLNDIDCFGEDNGTITLNATGGTPDYSYSLDQVDYQSNATFENLTPGDYTAYVQDNNNCISSYDFTITEPEALTLDVSDQTDLDCAGENSGEVILSAGGGSPNYQYSSDGVDFQDSDTFSDLSAGDYQFVVEDDNGCQTTVDVTIEEPDAIAITVDSQTDLLCAGDSDGAFSVSANGGTGDLSFSINGNSSPDGNFADLSAGDYTVEVTDANDCSSSIEVSITEPEALTLDNTAQTNVGCNGDADGMVSLSANGGTAGYQYELDGQSNTDGEFDGLSAGSYTATVTDANDCSTTLQIDIDEPTELSLSTSMQTDVNCNGDADGMVSLSANGGSGNYEYTLGNDTNTTGDFDGLSAGDYTATVTDENDCQSTLDFTIEEPAELAVSTSSQTNVSCNGDSNGAVSLSATGGSGNYEYMLNGETNTDGQFDGLSAGDYTATITDDNGCSNTLDVSISEPAVLALSNASQTDVACNGDSDGTVSLSATGGTADYQYELNGQSNNTGQFNGLSAGTYTANVTDANNCITEIDVTIEEPDVLILGLDMANDLSCSDSGDGSISVSANGGVGAYTYTLNGMSNNTGEFQNLNAGSYQLAVVDENDCSAVIDVTIDAPMELELAVVNTQGVDCDGGPTGVAEVAALGGTFPYTYTLGNQSNADGLFNGLAAGNYDIQVEDANGCSETVAVFIEQNSDILLSTSFTDVSCNGDNNGMIQLSGTGGVGNLSYTLDGMSSANGLFENLSAGDYLAVVTDEDNCSTSEIITITEPEDLTLATASTAMPDCFGEQNGSINALAAGGTGNYTYELNGVSNTTGQFDNLGAGNYAIQVTDANNCTEVLDVVLEQPMAIMADVQSTTDVSCNGDANGAVSLSANGGTGDLTYTLSGESNDTGLFNDLASGSYTAVISDANNCTSEINFSIEEPEAILLSLDEVTDISCNGENDGMIMAVSSGGTGPITYTLGNESNTTGVFENLSVGTYQIMVEDANACTTSIDANIEEPEVLEGIIIKLDDVSCNGEGDGSISLTAEGGTPGYQFEMNGETNTDGFFVNMDVGDYSIQITDANGCETTIDLSIEEPEPVVLDVQQTAQNGCNGDANAAIMATATGGNGVFTYSLNGQSNDTGTFDGLTEGTYMVVVSDEIGCTSSVEYVIEDPAPIVLNVEETQSILCAGEGTASIQVGANGGAGDYSFALDGITSTSGSFTDLAAGNYIVEVTDAEGCQNTMVFAIEEPEAIEVGLNPVLPVLCNGDDNAVVQLFATGGAGLISFTLNGETNNTGIFDGLSAGNYEASIIDENACESTYAFEITEPDVLSVTPEITANLLCNGDQNAAVQVVTNGGTAPYSYMLDNVVNETGTFEGLGAGTYLGVITDANNCTQAYELSIEEPTAITTVANVQDVLCFGDTDGSISLSANGGTGALTFELDGQTNDDGIFENLSSGDYVVNVTDENNCVASLDVSIEEPDELQLDWDMIQFVQCFGDQNGSVELFAGGGVEPYTFFLDDQESEFGGFDNLGAGSYEGEVIDANGCITITTIEVEEPEEVSVDVTNIIDDIDGQGGGFTLVPQVGNSPFMYSINGGPFVEENVFTGLPAGDYEIEAMDAAGCSIFISVTIDLINDTFEPAYGVDAMKVWPNPFSNQLAIEIDLANNQRLQMELFTIHGQKVMQQQVDLGQGEYLVWLEGTADLAKATYLLSVRNAEKVWYFKVLKQ